MKKKITGLLVVFALGLCLAGAAFAGAFYFISGPEEAVAPTVPTYENYYSIYENDWQTLLEDPKWNGGAETVLTASLKKTSGPLQCEVEVFYREKIGEDWLSCGTGNIALGGENCSFRIPENNGVKILAKATLGENGHATIELSVK